MTTGSWSVGDNAAHSPLYAYKAWSGTNGKFEAWDGGTRAKWNNYTMEHIKWTQSSLAATNFDGWANPPRHTIDGFKAINGWGSKDDLGLLNQLAEQIKGHSFDLAINMAESKRTYGLVLSNVRSLGSSLVNLKRGNFSQAFRALGVPTSRQRRLRARDISGRWLEMQYGWRPLIDQSYQAAKALEALNRDRTMRFIASKQRTKVHDLAESGGYQTFCRATISVKIICELYEELSLWRSLGLTNPASVVWEVVPYSFVVDWFLPVGSYLSALGVIPSLKGRFLTISKGTWKGDRFVKTSPSPAFRPTGGYGLKRNYIRYSRVPSSSLSVPRPRFVELPRALSPAHLYNAVALVHQALRN